MSDDVDENGFLNIRRREPRPEFLGPILGAQFGLPQVAFDGPRIHSQEEFLTALDILLDHTLHADECYIDDAQTECVCAIGKVRAAMPPCGAVRPRPFEDQRLTQPRKYWTCTRNAHPASPDRHVFG